MPDNNQFTFEISLSVLNHLGRNLYRSFATVLGEAISNSWDADSRNVYIYLDRDNNTLCIKDDGNGMSDQDFQGKFLKIGYSKRSNGESNSAGGRPYIGRKGIGKLALLSCAEKISVKSKVSGGEYIGGMIDNTGLDQAIKDDVSSHDYELASYDDTLFKSFEKDHNKGTIIFFENIKDGIHNTDDFLKKIIALYFRFSLVDSNFKIYLNDEQVTLESLKPLAESTQFVWNINNFPDPYLEDFCTKTKETIPITMSDSIKGFIASVRKPKDRNIHSTGERVSVDLFVNGRLRETDILKHLSALKARIPESYLYGQIHLDTLDSGIEDPFTSSREEVKSESKEYKDFLEELKKAVLAIIIQWDKLREKYDEDGDPDNPRKTPKKRKSEELANAVFNEYLPPVESGQYSKVEGWCRDLRQDASFNFESYADCFASENLLRKQIDESGLIPVGCTNTDPSGNTCENRYNPQQGNTSLCEYCKGERGKQSLLQQKTEAGTSIQIRNDEDNLLMYLDYIDLAKIIDNSILRDEDKPYKPLRNSVMHVARLTEEAKTKLTSIFDNVVATVKQLVGADT